MCAACLVSFMVSITNFGWNKINRISCQWKYLSLQIGFKKHNSKFSNCTLLTEVFTNFNGFSRHNHKISDSLVYSPHWWCRWSAIESYDRRAPTEGRDSTHWWSNGRPIRKWLWLNGTSYHLTLPKVKSSIFYVQLLLYHNLVTLKLIRSMLTF